MVVSAEKAGYEAVRALNKIIAGKNLINQTIVVRPTHVVTRQSTNVFAVTDRGVHVIIVGGKKPS